MHPKIKDEMDREIRSKREHWPENLFLYLTSMERVRFRVMAALYEASLMPHPDDILWPIIVVRHHRSLMRAYSIYYGSDDYVIHPEPGIAYNNPFHMDYKSMTIFDIMYSYETNEHFRRYIENVIRGMVERANEIVSGISKVQKGDDTNELLS